jgi:hypothetical protein
MLMYNRGISEVPYMMKRTNFYLDQSQLTALQTIAHAEGRPVADIAREAVDLLIHDRTANPRHTAAQRKAAMNAFVTMYEGSGALLSEADIENLVTKVNGRPRKFLNDTGASS